jgi:hypothetical protein
MAKRSLQGLARADDPGEAARCFQLSRVVPLQCLVTASAALRASGDLSGSSR